MTKTYRALTWLMTLSMPFFLGFSSIHILIGPAFLRWEYNKPNFPPDRYGFSQEERIELASVAVEFLASSAPPEEAIELLEEQSWQGEPLYNQRELSHMIDTKKLTDVIRIVAWITGAIVIGGAAGLASRKEAGAWVALEGLLNGSFLTTGILAAISLYILVGWQSFFTRFHQLLFPPGTWTFAYSEGLIRLFPEKLWFDVGVLLGVGTLAEAILIGAAAYLVKRQLQIRGNDTESQSE